MGLSDCSVLDATSDEALRGPGHREHDENRARTLDAGEEQNGRGGSGGARRGLKMNSRGTASLLKDSISFTDASASGLFEGHDLLRRGFTSLKNELLPSHPLELTEKNFQLNQDKTNFATLRNIQGIHAPLKLQMEFRAVKQVQRLPFLHSSNVAMDILRGNDECIGFEDILNDPSQSEIMGEPHMMMEHKLGLL